MAKQKIKIAQLGVLTSLAMVLSYIELLIPPVFSAFPGIKMGLPNIVVVTVLYCFGDKYAFAVSIVRVALVSLLFGNTVTMLYSIAGALLSLTLMSVLKKLDIFSCVGVSVVGGVMHNLGQIIVAIILLRTIEIGYYMIILTVSGTLAGVLIGLVAAYLTKRIKKYI